MRVLQVSNFWKTFLNFSYQWVIPYNADSCCERIASSVNYVFLCVCASPLVLGCVLSVWYQINLISTQDKMWKRGVTNKKKRGLHEKGGWTPYQLLRNVRHLVSGIIPELILGKPETSGPSLFWPTSFEMQVIDLTRFYIFPLRK